MNTINASDIKGDIPEGATHYEAILNIFHLKDALCVAVFDGEGWYRIRPNEDLTQSLEIIYDTDKPYVPEVGDECEARGKKLKITPFNKWSKCSFIAKNTGSNGQYQYIVKDCNGNAAILYEEDGVEFRPIQSEEDKASEWLRGVIINGIGRDAYIVDVENIITTLIKAGVKIPEGEK